MQMRCQCFYSEAVTNSKLDNSSVRPMSINSGGSKGWRGGGGGTPSYFDNLNKEIVEGIKAGRASKTKPPRLDPPLIKASYFLYVGVNKNAADYREVSKSVVKTKLK